MNDYIQDIISMIVQYLRNNSQNEIVDLIKKSDYSLEFIQHDGWNGGVDFYRLQLYLSFSEYSKYIEKKNEYEQIIYNALNTFYRDEHLVITGIDIVSKIERYIDWSAIAPYHTKESVISLLNSEKEYLIKTGTGELQIKGTSANDDYKKIHSNISNLLKQLGIEHANNYTDLWAWFNDYKKQNLESYHSRRTYINDLYSPLLELLNNSENNTNNITNLTEKPTLHTLSQYLKTNTGFDCPFGHININVKESLGQGGNGIVYKATLQNCTVAIKFLIEYSSKKLERFKAEYLNISIVRNKLKNIVNYILYGELNAGGAIFPYIIMEIYPTSLKSRKKQANHISFSEVMTLFNCLCDALGSFEEQDIIHRDLKPDNILIDKDGNFTVSDFGIAHFSSQYPIQGLTKKGERLANFEFSAPEQIQGGKISFATDIYALFQIIYWYVFNEINRGTGGKHLYDIFPDTDALYLDTLLYKGISNSPEDRYQNITEIYTAFNNMRFEPKEINPFDDMHTFSHLVRSTIPEFFNDIAYTNNKDDINSILLKFCTAKTNRPFEFNTGTSNNTIDNIEILENGNTLLNWHELNIAGMWGCLSNDTYNDILILETIPVKPYTINGQEEWAVAIIEDSHMIPIREIESGFVRYNGKVIPTSKLKIQERYLYPEDLCQRYYAIGAFAHCSIIQKNDCYLESLQEKENLTREDIKNYRKQISRNKSKELHIYL